MTTTQWIKSVVGPAPTGQEIFSKGRNFDKNHDVATSIVKQRVNKKFANSYYASTVGRSGFSRDYNSNREDAVDLMSREIALALTQGDSVHAASVRGAQSAGL